MVDKNYTYNKNEMEAKDTLIRAAWLYAQNGWDAETLAFDAANAGILASRLRKMTWEEFIAWMHAEPKLKVEKPE